MIDFLVQFLVLPKLHRIVIFENLGVDERPPYIFIIPIVCSIDKVDHIYSNWSNNNSRNYIANKDSLLISENSLLHLQNNHRNYYQQKHAYVVNWKIVVILLFRNMDIWFDYTEIDKVDDAKNQQ